MAETAQANCIDIVSPLMQELNARDFLRDVQLMGGIGSAVLKHPGTEILADQQMIVASPDFFVKNDDVDRFRPNGSLRDIDLLVLSSDPAYVGEVKALTEEVIGDQLEISVFGLHSATQLDEWRADPFSIKTQKTVLSDRYMHPDGSIEKSLMPFSVPVSSTAMESWTAQVGDRFFPVMGPGSAVVSYMTRSTTGVRPKDLEKVIKMTAAVHGKWPGVREWLYDGPGSSQLELAQIFQTLRRASPWARASRHLDIAGVVQLDARKVGDLRDHKAFMFHDYPTHVQEAILALAVVKARVLGTAESNKTIVRLYQKHGGEKKFGSVVNNQ